MAKKFIIMNNDNTRCERNIITRSSDIENTLARNKYYCIFTFKFE